MEQRDSFWRMMKQGRFRAFRNLPVGWVLQILHSTDRTERRVRLALEALLVAMLWYLSGLAGTGLSGAARLLGSFVIIHTLSWYLFGNFWVYMLDSFLWVKNPGIDGVLDYVDRVRRSYRNSGAVDAILIYGSMCRGMFHGRSDLDLRVVRSPGLLAGLVAVCNGLLLRIPAALRAVPVDFQVVDSLDFLRKQMRADERPIVVYRRADFEIPNSGLTFDEVLSQPDRVLKKRADGQAAS